MKINNLTIKQSGAQQIPRIILAGDDPSYVIKVYATPEQGFNPDSPAFILTASVCDPVSEDAIPHPAKKGVAIWSVSQSLALNLDSMPLPALYDGSGTPIKGMIRKNEADPADIRVEQYLEDATGADWQDFGPVVIDDHALFELQIALVKEARQLAAGIGNWYARAQGIGKITGGVNAVAAAV